MNEKVYVIVLNWNGWKDTVECVESLLAGDYPSLCVVVCDNGSTDGSTEEIPLRFGERIHFIANGSNLGYAAGNNRGIVWALQQPDCRYIWVLNNDTVVAPDAMRHMVARMMQDRRIGLCGANVLFFDRPEVQAWGGGTYNRWTGLTRNLGEGAAASMLPDFRQIEEKLEYLLGASVFVSREFVETVGLMSEEYFLFYEELDWAIRSQGSFLIGFAPAAFIRHKRGASTGDSADFCQRSELVDYYSLRNRILFSRKYFPYALPVVCSGMLIAVWNRCRRGQGGRWRLVLQALLDGLRNRGGERVAG